jgi:hypothetical protein
MVAISHHRLSASFPGDLKLNFQRKLRQVLRAFLEACEDLDSEPCDLKHDASGKKAYHISVGFGFDCIPLRKAAQLLEMHCKLCSGHPVLHGTLVESWIEPTVAPDLALRVLPRILKEVDGHFQILSSVVALERALAQVFKAAAVVASKAPANVVKLLTDWVPLLVLMEENIVPDWPYKPEGSPSFEVGKDAVQSIRLSAQNLPDAERVSCVVQWRDALESSPRTRVRESAALTRFVIPTIAEHEGIESHLMFLERQLGAMGAMGAIADATSKRRDEIDVVICNEIETFLDEDQDGAADLMDRFLNKAEALAESTRDSLSETNAFLLFVAADLKSSGSEAVRVRLLQDRLPFLLRESRKSKLRGEAESDVRSCFATLSKTNQVMLAKIWVASLIGAESGDLDNMFEEWYSCATGSQQAGK